MVASEFMYEKCRVNIRYEHGYRILEYDIEKILRMVFRILYLNLLGMHAASKMLTSSFTTLRLVGSQLLTHSKTDSQLVGSKLRTL